MTVHGLGVPFWVMTCPAMGHVMVAQHREGTEATEVCLHFILCEPRQ